MELIQQATEILRSQLAENDFLAGGGILMLLGGLFAFIRYIPRYIYKLIDWWMFIEIEVLSHDDSFTWINTWMAHQTYTKSRSRRLTVSTEGDSDEGTQKTILAPAPGWHWFFWNGHLVTLNRSRKDGKEDSNSSYSPPRETFSIKVLTRNRAVIHELVEEARVLSEPEDNEIQLFTYSYGSWDRIKVMPGRPFGTVEFPDGVEEELVSKIEEFYADKERYQRLGIPYRLGCLLYGKPGNGKTSAIAAIATKFHLNVCSLSLAGDMTDSKLQTALQNLPPRSLVLLEDVDCTCQDREMTKGTEFLSFSALLNCIDGVCASEGRLLFLTTNHKDKLDEALIRRGRVDIDIEFKNPSPAQLKRMCLRFFPGEEQVASQFCGLVPGSACMADVQAHLLGCKTPHEVLQSSALLSLKGNE